MKRGFVYKDDKTHKFWWIDYSGCSFAVGYGRCGSIGTFGLKEFDTEEECRKEAEKIIRSKINKGYVEDENFDFTNRLYLDNEEYGLTPKTSHPRFAEHFREEFYYSECDEEAPFGSDEGHDTLFSIYEYIRKMPDFDFDAFPRKFIEEALGMTYVAADTLDAEVVKEMSSDMMAEMNMVQSDIVTYATAFAQIKITGSISSELKERGIQAIKRLSLIDGMPWHENEIQSKMIDDLQSFAFTV
ncbi:WGR domain-containing protein [Prevotella sp. PINT]|jgi:Uncharacterized protein conserved in bacteria|uniref:WGR domain-containing protein n=1 Tax=Palleniella intestinalis TaxID=2736291 RepID=UPI001556FF77|nr:WGR domain-containing protein [Palleniella intestinalis]NPD80930.1 WGR domain-containing protein [Palleniella intestinalis]